MTRQTISGHPETGFREWNTSAYMEKHFEELGYTPDKGRKYPGFYADLDTGKPGPEDRDPRRARLPDRRKPPVLRSGNPLCSCLRPSCPSVRFFSGTAAALEGAGALDLSLRIDPLYLRSGGGADRARFREGLRKQGIIKYFGGKGRVHSPRIFRRCGHGDDDPLGSLRKESTFHQRRLQWLRHKEHYIQRRFLTCGRISGKWPECTLRGNLRLKRRQCTPRTFTDNDPSVSIRSSRKPVSPSTRSRRLQKWSPMCAALPSTRSANTISRSTRHLPLPLPRSAATWSWMTIRAIPVKQR